MLIDTTPLLGTPSRTKPALSVVIPTRGRPALLQRCLDALRRQTLAPQNYEIIVVDDGPSEDTRAVVRQCTAGGALQGPGIRYVASHGPHGPAAARNRGWRCARGDIIAFTDDDTEADADWLKSGLAAFRPDIHAITGRVVMPLPESPTDYELDAACLTQGEFVTANCFCRRAVLEALNGFDERFPMAWREDSDLQFRMLRAGARIVHAPEAVVVHPIRPAGWGVSLKQQKKVMFDALLYREHPRLYRTRIRSTARWDYYGAVVAALAACLAYLYGAPRAAIAFAAVWCAITGWLCFRRLRRTSRELEHIAEMLVTSALIPPLAVFWRIVGAIRFRVWLA